jgi:hypothetical protein
MGFRGGAQGGTGGAFAPPACMLKKALQTLPHKRAFNFLG